MILVPSRYLVKVPQKKESYLILYHSLFGDGIKVKQGVWDLIQRFKGGKAYPQSFNKKELAVYHNTIEDLKKRSFLVKKGLDEHSLVNKISRAFRKKLSNGCFTRTLWLEMASYCNFNCLHCFAPKIYEWQKGKKMDFRTAKLAVDGFIYLLRKNRKKNARIDFWGGEPILNWNVIKQTVEYVEKLTKKSSLGIGLNITTNASLFNNEILNFIKRHKIGVRLSLDGLEKENDQFRKFINGKGTFKSILKGMDGLSKHGIDFSVQLCLNDYNFNSVEKLLNFMNNRYKCTSFYISFIDCQKHVSNFDRHSNQEKAERIVQIYDYALKKKFSVTPENVLSLLEKTLSKDFFALHNCRGLYSSLYVNPSGLVYNCQMVTLPVGTVEHIKEIPQGKKYKHVAMRTIERIKGCKGCEIEGFCAGGCAGIAQSYSGDIYNTSHRLYQSFFCDLRRRLFREMLKYYLKQHKFSLKSQLITQ